MKTFLYIAFMFCLLFACTSSQKITSNSQDPITKDQDIVRISNDAIEYEIIIIEPGFNFWLKSTARPEGYYSQNFLESRNRQYVVAWNQRTLDPIRYGGNLYTMQIDYESGVDYGYEVNYKLYNYFIYFQLTYNQKLAGFIPRI